MLAVLLGATALLWRPFDFFAEGPYDRSVPNPEGILGYAIGDRHTTFRDQERALASIAAAGGKRVQVVEYGKSWEGRPLRIYAVSTPENMARLEQIRTNNLRRSRGEAVGGADPAIIWINECIHGNETASFESAMPLMYNLVASRSERMAGILRNAIVLVNPVYNPDGHERYVVWYNSFARGEVSPGAYEQNEPSTINGRTNHYRFDMNRDRVAMSQIETRQEVAEFLKWHPQVYVDQHGQVETFFFPPNAMAQNANADRARVNRWTEIFGKATGAAFDRQGWSYFIGDTFDLYYPGYLDSWTTLSGAIGMTHETDGGRLLRSQRSDGSTLTLRDGVSKHFTAALAVIQSAASHRAALIDSFVAYRKKAATGESAGKFKRVVLQGDPRELNRLKEQLAKSGIESSFARQDWKQEDAHDYWSKETGAHNFQSGSLIIDIAQPQGALAKTLLEPGSDFEPEFVKAQLAKKQSAPEGEDYPGPEGAEFYDLTAWSLPYAHNLRAWWCESTPAVQRGEMPTFNVGSVESPVGYAILYRDQDDVLAVADALAAGLRSMVTPKQIEVGSLVLPRGTFLFLAGRNDEGYGLKLRTIASNRGATVLPLPTSFPSSGRQGPGSENIITLKKPRIGVIFGNGANMAQVGSTWFTLEQVFRIPFASLSSAATSRNLDDYTCILVPPGAGISGAGKLREWVQGGGTLVVLGSPAWALGSSGFVELAEAGGDAEDLPGALFRADLDPRSFLSYGYSAPQIAVPVEGSSFFKRRKEGGSVLTFSDDAKTTKLLSGWSWPENTEKALAGTVWLQDVPVGRGHVVIFMSDPTSRAMWPGLHKLLLNAMIIGPGA